VNDKGLYGQYGLSDWWTSEFTEIERARFKELYKPYSISLQSLTEGPVSDSDRSVVWFLTTLAGYFSNKADTNIGLKFLKKAEELIEQGNILDKHFLYLQLIESHYKNREKDHHYQLAKYYCQKQISIAPAVAHSFLSEFPQPLPSHTGFHQLAIILEKEKKYHEAIELCKEALQLGWNGDWLKRIEKIENKLLKAKS
jgi:tetratricopeptide (TPR) repeat protein